MRTPKLIAAAMIALPLAMAPGVAMAGEQGAPPPPPPGGMMPPPPPPPGGGSGHWGGGRWGGTVGGYWYAISYAPGGWNGYRRPSRGWKLPSYWYSPSFFISDYARYRLAPPPAGYVWVRYYNDAVLIDSRRRVADCVPGIAWAQFDGAAAGGGAAAGAGYAPPPVALDGSGGAVVASGSSYTISGPATITVSGGGGTVTTTTVVEEYEEVDDAAVVDQGAPTKLVRRRVQTKRIYHTK